MTAATHRRFGICFALLGALFLNLTSINYYIMVIILCTFSQVGAKFPDVDHHWKNVKDKTVINWILNKFIHLTNGKHRSWQTHSLDIALMFLFCGVFIPTSLYNDGLISLVNKDLSIAILLGFSLGWLSHLFADMLNYSGIRITFLSNKKIRLVPKKLFKIRFKTGAEWENAVDLFQKYFNVILGCLVIVYPVVTNPNFYEKVVTVMSVINN